MNHRNLSVVFLYTTPAAVQSCANSLAFSVQKPKLKLIYDDTTEFWEKKYPGWTLTDDDYGVQYEYNDFTGWAVYLKLRKKE